MVRLGRVALEIHHAAHHIFYETSHLDVVAQRCFLALGLGCILQSLEDRLRNHWSNQLAIASPRWRQDRFFNNENKGFYTVLNVILFMMTARDVNGNVNAGATRCATPNATPPTRGTAAHRAATTGVLEPPVFGCDELVELLGDV